MIRADMFKRVRRLFTRLFRWLRGHHLNAKKIRFGHAFPNPRELAPPDPIVELCDLLAGGPGIGPRPPTDPSAVSAAEAILGLAASKRPVYAYVGCLHPELGRIGLIVEPPWYHEQPHGITRCDSGGLASRKGNFGYLSKDVAEALIELTMHAPTPWEPEIDDEIAAAYSGWDAYLDGTHPRSNGLDTIRRECFKKAVSAGEEIDRRLWTWEARAFSWIRLDHLAAIAVTHEVYKQVNEFLREQSMLVNVPILHGTASAVGVEHFRERQVFEAFKVVG